MQYTLIYTFNLGEILEKLKKIGAYYPKKLDSNFFYRTWYWLIPYYPIFWIVRSRVGIWILCITPCVITMLDA